MKVALLFAYIGFLRQSNLAPRTVKSFDKRRHTKRRDVTFAPPGLVVTLPWSKTNQTGDRSVHIPLPILHNHSLCPVAAYSILQDKCPVRQSAPLLSFHQRGALRIFTTSTLQSILQVMLAATNTPAGVFSFHALRRGGATAAYNAGVKVTQVQRHGSWASDTFWQYIAQDLAASPVAAAFTKLISPTV